MTSEATPTIANSQGSPQPNPRHHGFKGGAWRELQKLLDENAKLRGEAKRAAQELQEAGERIKRVEAGLREQRAAALRGGPAPDEAKLEKAKSHREALGERTRDYRRAGQMVDAEIRDLVATHREEWQKDVQERGGKLLAEAQDLADALSRKLSETDQLAGVVCWLASNGQSYTPSTPIAITIQDILHQKRRELGLLEEVLG